jgi:hypothetical protein
MAARRVKRRCDVLFELATTWGSLLLLRFLLTKSSSVSLRPRNEITHSIEWVSSTLLVVP